MKKTTAVIASQCAHWRGNLLRKCICILLMTSLLLTLTATVRLVIPTGARQVSLESQVLVAESIIVGTVPGTFVQVPQYDDVLNFAIP